MGVSRSAFTVGVSRWAFIAAAAVLVAGAVALTLLVLAHPVASTDVTFSRQLQGAPSPGAVTAMRGVSLFGSSLVMIPLTAAVAVTLILLGLRRDALYFVVASILMVAVTQVAKALINRPRPRTDLVGVFDHPIDPSFPSGHVTAVVVFTGFLLFALVLARPEIAPGWKVAWCALAALAVVAVGISRIYLGAHWVSDVLGGYFVGGTVLLLTLLVWSRGEAQVGVADPVDVDRPDS